MSSESNPSRPDVDPGGLDFQAIWRAVLPPFLVWAGMVGAALVGRQPGVICVTPVAWLLACWVGMSCVARSRSARKSALVTEAALAGGALGLLQGLLFVATVPFMGEVKPDERQKAVLVSVVMVVVGTLVSAVLSAAVGAARANRREGE